MKCNKGPECTFLRKWLSEGKEGRRCIFYHSKHEISEAERDLGLSSATYPKFSIACWHCSSSKDYRRTSLCYMEHDTENECDLQNCSKGESCWMFRYLKNSNNKQETYKLRQCIDHCLTHGHRFSAKKWYYHKIINMLKESSLTKPVATTEEIECTICMNCTNENVCRLSCGHQFHSNCISQWISSHKSCPNCRVELSPMVSCAEIKEIISRPDFDINHTEEKDPYKHLTLSFACNEFDQARWDAGFYHLLCQICKCCDFETFKMALSCRGRKLDDCTLMECIKKGDVKYLNLIGKDEFAKHPTLRIPVYLNDPRFTDHRNIITYETANTIINDPSYNLLCKEKFVSWNLFVC